MSSSPVSSSPVTTNQLIDQRIDEARRALWWGELVRTLLAIVIGSMVAILAWLLFDHWIYASGPLLRTLSLLALIAIATWFVVRRVWPVLTSRVSEEYAAWALEQGHSDYRQQLTSYVTLKPDGPVKGLRARIVSVLGSRAAGLLKAHDELPAEATGTFRWWIAAACVFALLMAYIVGSPKSSLASAQRLIAPLSAIDPAQRVSITEVQPGDAEALAGRSVPVSALVTGLRSEEAVVCRWAPDGAEFETELTYDATTGMHQGEMELPHSASGLVSYRIEAGDAVAGPFLLDVENVPVVAIECVSYQPPEYTGRKSKTVSSPSITAIDGTTVRITAKTNRRVERAEVQFNPKQLGQTVRATAGRRQMEIAEDGITLTAEIKLKSSRGKAAAVEPESYRIRVWDSNEQANPDPIVYPIRIIPDLPPEVAIVVPKKSPIEVPITAQQIIEVHAMDADFELQEVSLRIDRGIDTLSEPLIWLRREGESGRGNQVMEYRFRPAEHRVNVGDTVRITAIALDNREVPGDRSVEPNRSVTDPVEIRIVDGDSDLPDDPSDNDGLSRPDDRPASDVDQSQQGEGEQQGGGGSGSSQQGDSSQGDGSGQQGEGAKGSGTPEKGNGEGGGQRGDSADNNQQPQDMPQDGEGSQDAPSQEDSGNQENAGSQGESNNSGATGETKPGEQNGSNNANQNAGDPSEQPQQQPGERQPGNETGDPQGQPGEGQTTENGGEQQGPQSAGEQSAGEQGSTGENSGSDNAAPPKHDGEAFERIKEFVEKKREEQSQQSPKGNDSGANQREPGEGQTERDGSQSTDGSQSKEQGGDSEQSGNKERGDENGITENQNDASNGDDQNTGDQGKGENQESPKGEGGDRGDSSEGMTGESQEQSPGESSQTQDPDKQNGESSEQPSGEGAGDQNDASSSNESTQQPDNQSGQTEGSNGSSDPQKGEPGASQERGDGMQGDDPSGESSDEGQESGDKGNQSDQGSKGESGSKSESGGEPSQPEGDGAEGSQGDSSTSGDSSNSSSKSPNSDSPGQPSNSNSNSDARSNGDGSGTGSMPGSAEDAGNEPPPPDLEYAKEATDMVLDYLDETREQVDPDLLKDLNWTEQDLERFRQRWEKVRDLKQAPSDVKPNSELEDALKSLGLKPKARGTGTREGDDGFRSLRDSGNRRKAPAAFRDAFDAFRSRSK